MSKSEELHARITKENSDFINEVAKLENRSRSSMTNVLITEAKLARVNNRIKELKEGLFTPSNDDTIMAVVHQMKQNGHNSTGLKYIQDGQIKEVDLTNK